MRKAEEQGDGWQGTAYPGERALSTPTLELPIDRLFAIDWHVWRASVDPGLWVADGRIAA